MTARRTFAPQIFTVLLLGGAVASAQTPTGSQGSGGSPYDLYDTNAGSTAPAGSAVPSATPAPAPQPAMAPASAPAAPVSPAPPDEAGQDEASRGDGPALQVRLSWPNMLGDGTPRTGYPLGGKELSGTMGYWFGDIFVGLDLGLSIGDSVADEVAVGVTLQRTLMRVGPNELRTVGHLLFYDGDLGYDDNAILLSATVGLSLLHELGPGWSFGAELSAGRYFGFGAAEDSGAAVVTGAFVMEWALREATASDRTAN